MEFISIAELRLVQNPDLITESEEVYASEDEANYADYLNSLLENEDIDSLSDLLAENLTEEEIESYFDAVEALQGYLAENVEFENENQINEAILSLEVDSVGQILEDIAYETGITEAVYLDVVSTVEAIYEPTKRFESYIAENVDTQEEYDYVIAQESTLNALKVVAMLVEANFVQKSVGALRDGIDTFKQNREQMGGRDSLYKFGLADIKSTAAIADKIGNKFKKKSTPTKVESKAAPTHMVFDYTADKEDLKALKGRPKVDLFSKNVYSGKTGKLLHGAAANAARRLVIGDYKSYL